MAETLKLPNAVVDSDWKDDVDVDYAIYGGNEKQEREYVSQEQLSKEKIERIKKRKICMVALFMQRKGKTSDVTFIIKP